MYTLNNKQTLVMKGNPQWKKKLHELGEDILKAFQLKPIEPDIL
jgi:hypothetical protein